MLLKKANRYPSKYGVYYCVPNKTLTGWNVLTLQERDPDTGDFNYPEEGESVYAHANLYLEVVFYFQKEFGIDISDIGRRCIPRGRIAPGCKILHGNDTPKEVYYKIVDLFGYTNITHEFVEDDYQAMDSADKEHLIRRFPEINQLMERV